MGDAVVFVLSGGGGVEAVGAVNGTGEARCVGELSAVHPVYVALAVAPLLVNLLTVALLVVLAYSIAHLGGVMQKAEDVFLAVMLLHRTAIKSAIPRRALDAIKKEIGEPAAAIKARLTDKLKPKSKRP